MCLNKITPFASCPPLEKVFLDRGLFQLLEKEKDRNFLAAQTAKTENYGQLAIKAMRTCIGMLVLLEMANGKCLDEMR